MNDPFALLGLARDATSDDIRRAYRRLAMRWHPDRNPSHEAEERFKNIKAAYELLLDAGRRAAWEASEQAKKTAAAKDKTRNETTADATAAPQDDGESAEITLHLELEQAAAGCTKTVSLASASPCTTCHGSGSIEHRTSVVCSLCSGVGSTRHGRDSKLCKGCKGRGYVRQTPCADCSGSGLIRSHRQIQIRIPAGTQAGDRLRLARQHRPRSGQAEGDLFVTVDFYPHPFFRLDGKDLHCEVPVNIFRLLHAGPLTVPTLTGMQEIQLEAYPRHSLDYRIAGLGYPGRHGRGAGHLQLHLQPVFPQQLSDAERKLLLRLEKSMLSDLAKQAPELAAWERKLWQRQRGPE